MPLSKLRCFRAIRTGIRVSRFKATCFVHLALNVVRFVYNTSESRGKVSAQATRLLRMKGVIFIETWFELLLGFEPIPTLIYMG